MEDDFDALMQILMTVDDNSRRIKRSFEYKNYMAGSIMRNR